MRRIKAYLKADLFKEFFLTAGAQIMSSGMGFILRIALQNILKTELFGVYQTAQAVLGITNTITDAGLAHAMVRFASQYANEGNMAKAWARIATALVLRLVLTLLTTVVGYFMVDYLAQDIYGNDALAEPMRWVFLGLVGGTLYGHYMFFTQALQRFGLRSIITVSTAAIRVGLFVIMWALAMLGPSEMIILDAVVNLIGFSLGMYFAPKGMMQVTRAEFKESVRELVPFCKYTGIIVVAGSIFEQLDTLMLAKFTSDEVVGIYGCAWTYAMVLNFITGAVANVMFPKVTSMEKTEELKAFIKSTIKFTVPIAIATLPALPFMSWWLPWFQPDYADGLPVFYIMYVGLICDMIFNPLGYIHYSINRPDILVKLVFARIAVNFTANYMLIPEYGAIGAAAATVVTRVFGGAASVGIIVYILRKRQQAEANGEPPPEEPLASPDESPQGPPEQAAPGAALEYAEPPRPQGPPQKGPSTSVRRRSRKPHSKKGPKKR
ncbi:MAG: oligosaccharide flippase family protein [Bradymonadia bacterium]